MIVGHKEQQDFFANAISSNRLSHAYLFTGDDGIGKKKFAVELAKALLCEFGRYFSDCDCKSCRMADARSHPDMHLYGENDDLKIATVRTACEIVDSTAFMGGWKVVIFDNAHKLCQGDGAAASALLKTIEEPSNNTLFILITSKVEKLLTTIISRCIKIPFSPLSNSELIQALKINKPDIDWGNSINSSTITAATGSVTKALLINELSADKLISALKSKDKVAVGDFIFRLRDKESDIAKERLTVICNLLYNHCLDNIKRYQRDKDIYFCQYLMDFNGKLDYNINIDIALVELYSKINDTIS